MNSKRPVVPEGITPQSRQLAVTSNGTRPDGRSPRLRALRGVMWCSIGSAFVCMAPVLSNVVIAFGASLAAAGRGRRERVLTPLIALAVGLVSAYLLAGVYYLPMVAISVLGGCALADSYARGKLRTGSLLALAAAIMWAMMGTDMVSSSLQGTTIPKLITDGVNSAVESSAGSLDLSGTQALIEARDTVVALWPTLYFVVALAMVGLSVFGSWLGAKAGGAAVTVGAISHYDVPLWVGVLFALGVAAQLFGPHLPAWQDLTTMVGANVVMCTRLALMVQGISVLLWWLRERRAAMFARTFVVLAALWLEMSFALTSIVGLLDMGFNFRRLPRKRPPIVAGAARER